MATEIKVPDIGDFKDVPIIEIHVKPGDAIKADDPLISLESDKATMDVPASGDGTVEELLVKIGDKVSEGSPILRLKADGAGAAAQPPEAAPPPSVIAQQEPAPPPKGAPPQPAPARPAATGAPPVATAPATAARAAAASDPEMVHASPGVRRLARELEVDLAKVKGTGEKGRIT